MKGLPAYRCIRSRFSPIPMTGWNRVYLLVLIAFLLQSCNFSDTLRRRAFYEEERGNYELAMHMWELLTKKDPTDYYAFINLGWVRYKTGDLQGAIEAQTAAIALDDTRLIGYMNRGLFSYERENYPQALLDYHKSVELLSSPSGIVSLMPLQQDQGNPFFSGSQQESSGTDLLLEDAVIERGMTYYQMDSLQRAVADFRFCLDRGYEPAECSYWLGMTYRKVGDHELARKYLSDAAALGYEEAIRLPEEEGSRGR